MSIVDSTKYNEFFAEVLKEIQSARYRAQVAINKELIQSYFNIGKIIVNKQTEHSWGKSIVEKLSKDVNKYIDGIKGYSSQNLWYMRQFFLEYDSKPELFELASQIPWSHNLLILSKIKTDEEKSYYLEATKLYGWSRAVLLNQILANAYQVQKKLPKQSNFPKTLPEHLSEQANESLKSVYNLDFLGISKPVLERKLENKLILKIKDFLLELGYGFCFIGNQYKLKLGSKEYFIDLLFYHRFLKCLVAIELKTVEFEPEFAGKMNFYLELLDDQQKQPEDNPSIGLILCPQKDHLEVEYALRIQNKPIGVSEYRLTKELPDSLKGKLPSIEELKVNINTDLKR
jgi:predicted nuclease of restriction endonuclease-like (RecB) superfamily